MMMGGCIDIWGRRLFRGICGRMGGGSVAEWLKAHDSKSCSGNTDGGSNPLASAKIALIISPRVVPAILCLFFILSAPGYSENPRLGPH